MDNKAADAFRTISEAAEELDLPQHVLRFWETRFRDIKPMKRGGGRRYYRPDDIDLLRGIRHLLYGEGYTIRGVQRILREQGVRFVQEVWHEGATQPPHGSVEFEDAPEEEEAEAEAAEVGAGLRGRIASFIGRDLGDSEDDVPERPEPPLESAPVPRVEPDDRAAHGGVAPLETEPPESEPAQQRVVAASADFGSGELQRLQAALNELGACRKLIDAAMAPAE